MCSSHVPGCQKCMLKSKRDLNAYFELCMLHTYTHVSDQTWEKQSWSHIVNTWLSYLVPHLHSTHKLSPPTAHAPFDTPPPETGCIRPETLSPPGHKMQQMPQCQQHSSTITCSATVALHKHLFSCRTFRLNQELHVVTNRQQMAELWYVNTHCSYWIPDAEAALFNFCDAFTPQKSYLHRKSYSSRILTNEVPAHLLNSTLYVAPPTRRASTHAELDYSQEQKKVGHSNTCHTTTGVTWGHSKTVCD